MCGQSAVGDEVPPEIQAYGFNKLNQFLDELATDRLTIYREQRVGPFDVHSGEGDVTTNNPITIGPGGMWDTPRPEYIDRAGVIYTAGNNPNPEEAMHIFSTKEWSRISVKGVTSSLSRTGFYDRHFNPDGFGYFYIYPVPSANFKVVLYVPVAVPEFPLDVDGNPDYTTTIALPPGYRSMLVSNLAKIMQIGIAAVSADLEKRAEDSLSRVKSANVVTHTDALDCDGATLNPGGQQQSGWDWISGGIS